jgi:hypothetical protein
MTQRAQLSQRLKQRITERSPGETGVVLGLGWFVAWTAYQLLVSHRALLVALGISTLSAIVFGYVNYRYERKRAAP